MGPKGGPDTKTNLSTICRPQEELQLQLLWKREKKPAWSESAIDHRLSAKLVPNFADRGSHMVSVKDPYSCILGFLDRSLHFSIK
jgi:hypothetical protein